MPANAEAEASRAAWKSAAIECRHQLHAVETANQQCEQNLTAIEEAVHELEQRSMALQECQTQLEVVNATQRDREQSAQQSMKVCEHKLQAAENVVQQHEFDHQKERRLWAAKDAEQRKDLARQKELGQEVKQAAAKAAKACKQELREADDELKEVKKQKMVAARDRTRYMEALEAARANSGQRCKRGDGYEKCLVMGNYDSKQMQQNMSNVGCEQCNCSNRSNVGERADGGILGTNRVDTGNRSSLLASLETSDSGLILEALLFVMTTSVSMLRKAVLVATDSKDFGILDTFPEQAAAEAAAVFTRGRRWVCVKASARLRKVCVQAPKLLQVAATKTENRLAALFQAHPDLKVWLPSHRGTATAVNGAAPSEEAALRFLARCLALVIWLLAFVYWVLWRGICVVLIWKLLVGTLFLGPLKFLLRCCCGNSSENGPRRGHTPVATVAAQAHLYV